MVEQTVKGWTYSGIKVKICNIMFLHSKERWVTTFGLRLLET